MIFTSRYDRRFPQLVSKCRGRARHPPPHFRLGSRRRSRRPSSSGRRAHRPASRTTRPERGQPQRSVFGWDPSHFHGGSLMDPCFPTRSRGRGPRPAKKRGTRRGWRRDRAGRWGPAWLEAEAGAAGGMAVLDFRSPMRFGAPPRGLVLSGLLFSSAALAAPACAPGANDYTGRSPRAAAPAANAGSLDFALAASPRGGAGRAAKGVRWRSAPCSRRMAASSPRSPARRRRDAEIRYADGNGREGEDRTKTRPGTSRSSSHAVRKMADGLMPTDADPRPVGQAFLPARRASSAPQRSASGQDQAHAKEGEAAQAILDFDLKGLPSIPGAPIIPTLTAAWSGSSRRACKDAAPAAPGAPATRRLTPCTPVTIGVPVTALAGSS